MSPEAQVGDRRSYDGAVCTVRYIGEVKGTSGSWLGVEWDDPTRGKHDGSHKGERYFSCLSKATTAASFVRPTRTPESPQSFVTALVQKYTAEVANAPAVHFSGKIAERVGFEKIRNQQADLAQLRFAILDGERVASAYAEGDAPIRDSFPKIHELNLSRNLFQKLAPVVDICVELPRLRSLHLNGNRFQEIFEDQVLRNSQSAFSGVQDLAVEETLMSWEEICHVATRFCKLATLSASSNQLSSLPSAPFETLSSTLVSLNLEFNEFTSIADVTSLGGLKSLRNLHLKGNNITSLVGQPSDTLPVLSERLQYLDVSYNRISSWEFIDDLPTCFPGLTALRFAHNPIYDNPDPDFSAQSKNVTEEAYMFTVGRLGKLNILNFGSISKDDRQNAEMFYLGRIGKHLAAVAEKNAAEVLQNHKRFKELCEIYGPPHVNRQKEINPAFLEARLVNVQFSLREDGEVSEKTTKIPRSRDIYAVKGIAGKLFNLKPLGLRLIWETGEWDPVAGFDDEVDDSSDEEGDFDTSEEANVVASTPAEPEDKPGKWVKREVELQDGPRQLGFCVDGLEAKIRVEIR